MLDPQMKRGLIEVCVLSAVSREDSHGYKIVKNLSPFVAISGSTLYPILRRLESGGALSVHSVEHNGRLRKIYRITEAGRRQIRDFIEGWSEIAAMYEFIKGGVENE